MSASSHIFGSPDADMIIRAPLRPDDPESTEFRDFHTHKAILSSASTVFHDMFSVPQPPQPADGDTNLPIVQVTESAEVFETFLQFIYPIEPPTINSPQNVYNLLQLASKYLTSGVHARLRQALVSPSFLRSDPVWVYAIACHMDLGEETKLAITHTYQIDLVQDVSHSLLQSMTTEMYNRLLRSHATRRQQLITALNQTKSPPSVAGKCSCGPRLYAVLYRGIRLLIWEKPVLDRRRLDSCLDHIKAMPKSECRLGTSCRVSPQAISAFLARVLDKIEELDQTSNH